MSSASFGTVIPVTALNLGFLGNVSRIGERVIAARQVLPTALSPISFGDGVVIVSNAVGGYYQQIGDFIAGGGTFTAAKFAGVAVRNVKTMLIYTALSPIQTPQIGQYAASQMAEALERGSVTVKINNGSPTSQGPVFVRTVVNGTIPAGVVGGFEAIADGTNTVQLTGVVFRTGVIDANGIAEITLLSRVAA
jgi:hypothetical protein